MEEYTITSFKAGDFKDRNGNTWCDVVFEGYGEPCKWVVKDPSKVSVGDKVRGEVKDWESAKGKIFPRFYRDNTPQPQPDNKQDDAYWDDRNESIRAQWAIGQAVALWNGVLALGDKVQGSANADEFIERNAKHFYEMVDRVKGSEPVKQEVSGHDFAKAKRDEIVSKTTNPGNDQSLSNAPDNVKEVFNSTNGDREDEDSVDLNDLPY